MKRVLVAMLVVCSCCAVIPRAWAGLPETLNFENITATHVNQTVPEAVSNEKEVEYGDFDNDGDLDAVIAVGQSDFNERLNKLYRNDNGVFNEVSGAPIISGFSTEDVTRNAFFRDYDQDGWLDIIVVNDANNGGEQGRTKIYIYKHPGGVFSHFDEEGMSRLGPNTGGAACGGVSEDFDGDGDFDLYVGNYPFDSQDTMYFNDSTGFFDDVTSSRVPSDSDYTVDVATSDINGDGKLDLLVSNWGANYVYYNDNLGGGSDVGDFSYAGSQQNVGSGGASENAMEAADFNNDERNDIYWANGSGSTQDIILENTGNDPSNKAVFSTFSDLPDSVRDNTSRKATVADLNEDGRVDVIVMKEASSASRPTILRNTSVNGGISFVDWTPGHAFPDGATHMGWHAAAFDADDDEDLDIFLGGYNNDHLFRQVDSNEVEEDALGGTLPGLYNADPVVVSGTFNGGTYVLEVLARGPGGAGFAADEPDVRRVNRPAPDRKTPVVTGEVGTSDEYVISDVPGGGHVSIVLNSTSDLLLEVFDSSETLLASSDRGGKEIEEALQVTAANVPLTVRVTLLELGDPELAPPLAEDSLGIACNNLSDCVAAGGGSSSSCIDGRCYINKLRFLSVDGNPLNSDFLTARRVRLDIGGGNLETIGWISLTQSGSGPAAPHVLSQTPEYANWSDLDGGGETHTVHLTDCRIVPGKSYIIQEIAQGSSIGDEESYGPPLALNTTRFWGDVIGPPLPGETTPTGPDGIVNLGDVLGSILVIEGLSEVPGFWFDVEPETVNNTINLADALFMIQAIEGDTYPFSAPADCP